VIFVLVALAGCGSKPSTNDELDIAIREASDRLSDTIARGSKIVILNIQSPSADLSDYIIDELISNAINDRLFSVVDRTQLDLIRQEQNFQFSGEVDDDTAMEIGRFLGAQTIVSGTMRRMGQQFRMTIRALNVQTAQVQAQYNRNISESPLISTLLVSRNRLASNPAQTTQHQPQVQASVTSPNTSRSSAAPVSLGQAVPVTFDRNNQSRWFVFQAPRAGTLVVYTSYAAGNLDTLIRLLDSSGAQLARDDDSGEGRNARISRNVQPGAYFIEIFTHAGRQGDTVFHSEFR
jgi:TolB-like protein